MKQIVAIMALLSLFTSCKKNDPTPQQPASSFKFTANGTTNDWNGSLATNSNQGAIIKIETTGGLTGYTLEAMNGSASNSMILFISTGALTITTYSVTNTSTTHNFTNECEINSKGYVADKIGDFTSLTITKIDNGYASGTFTSRMTSSNPITTSTKIDITNGVFNNIKILN